MLRDPLRVELVGERLRRRVPEVVRAVLAGGVVDADVQDFFQRVFGEEIDFLVAIVAQLVIPALFRAGAIVGQLAEVFADRPLRAVSGRDPSARQPRQPQGESAKRKAAAMTLPDRRHVLLRSSVPGSLAAKARECYGRTRMLPQHGH